jgi:hypothetical protein
MANAREVGPPDNGIVSARLTAIEERLNEVRRRLDEMKNLVAILDQTQPRCQCADAED